MSHRSRLQADGRLRAPMSPTSDDDASASKTGARRFLGQDSCSRNQRVLFGTIARTRTPPPDPIRTCD
ncbi:hypothetical protein EYF80_046467 [Liparis tanakae]|uniref:Uncharacterized protein n=1 Tax=Liparis tanakae TaxID=230148 RepID=A0A4Z2FQS6_9TELE|nr:hypothetical protein EYF80_046467 [Liparis tanakae]